MGVLIKSLLMGLVVLFMIRLYVTNDPFAVWVNKLFTRIEREYGRFVKLTYRGIKIHLAALVLSVTIIMLLLLVGAYDFLAALLILTLIIIPGIPLFLDANSQQQKNEFERVVEGVERGKYTITEVHALKSALKRYYAKKYAPRKPRGKPSVFLARLAVLVMAIVRPHTWPRLVIPKVTALPFLASLFESSPYHARYRQYQKFYDSVYDHLYMYPYHLTVTEILIDEEFLMITFRGTKDHPLERARALARQLEQEYGWDEETILVNEEEAGVKFFLANVVLAG